MEYPQLGVSRPGLLSPALEEACEVWGEGLGDLRHSEHIQGTTMVYGCQGDLSQ